MQHHALVAVAARGRRHAFPNFLEQLGAKAGQLGDVAGIQRRFQIRHAVHLQLVVKELHALRSEARDPQEIEQAGRNCGNELLTLGQDARLDECGDFLGDSSTDTGQVGQVEFPPRHQLGDRVRMIGDGAGGVAVRAHLEWIACGNLQEVRNVSQQSCDLGVLHVIKYPYRLLPSSYLPSPTVRFSELAISPGA